MRRTIIGNWKMFKKLSDINIFFSEFNMALEKNSKVKVNYGIAVPSIYLQNAVELSNGNKTIKIYAQDVHHKPEGAFTGNISYTQLKDCNVDGSIIGHSERRQMYNDTDSEINKKVQALVANEMTAILCVGETAFEYKNKISSQVVSNQIKKAFESILEQDLKNIIVAYEPVWAIGTGNVPKLEEVENIIIKIRKVISQIYNERHSKSLKILYGGSVNKNNINEFLNSENINGFLVGGASLNGTDFANMLIEASKYEQ